MKCPRCAQESQFCLECATPLALRCGNCGTELPTVAKLCFECATPVAPFPSSSRFASPETYTPRHLAERIINSKPHWQVSASKFILLKGNERIALVDVP